MKTIELELKHLNYLLIICLLALSIYTVFAIHGNYLLPFHSEEWDHITLTKGIQQELASGEKIVIGFNWEIGYHVFLLFINEITRLDFIPIALTIPTIIAFLFALNTFILARFLTKSYMAALFSAIFVLLLKSNLTLLGLWFLVPMAFGIAMLPLLLYFFAKALTSKKHWLLLLILFAFTTLVHPVYTIILLPVFAIYLLLNPKYFKRNQIKIVIAIFVLILLLPFFSYRLLYSGNFTYSMDTFKLLVDSASQRLTFAEIFPWAPKFFFPEYLGIILFSLAVIGFSAIIALKIISFVKRKELKKENKWLLIKKYFSNRQLFILPVFLIVMLAFYLQYHLTGTVFLAPYERSFMAIAAVFLITAGIGLYYLIQGMKKIVNSLNLNQKALDIIFALLFFSIAIFLLSQVTFEPFAYQNDLYQNLSNEQLPVIDWIKANTQANASILALPWHSLAIQQLAERGIYATPSTRAGYGLKEEILSFFIVSCDEKTVLMQKYKPDLIVSTQRIECQNINKVFDQKNIFAFKAASFD